MDVTLRNVGQNLEVFELRNLQDYRDACENIAKVADKQMSQLLIPGPDKFPCLMLASKEPFGIGDDYVIICVFHYDYVI